MVEVRTQLHEEIDSLVQSGIHELEAGRMKEAHKIFRAAYEKSANDAGACSYYGYTLCFVEDKAHKGLELCAQAIKSAEPDPMFFHNIGMIYVILNKRREAVGAFKRGLSIDRSNRKIFEAWKKHLGWRRDPAISFLSRDNFLNKMIGKITYARAKKQGKL